MEQISSIPENPQPAYKNRGCLLMLFGSFLFLLGLGFSAIGGLTLMAGLAGMNGAPFNTMVPGIALYGLLGLFCMVMGVGTFLGRRNIRNIMLAASWMTLIVGVLSCLIFVVIIPPIMQNSVEIAAAEEGAPPAALILPVIVITILFLLSLYILLPGIFVLFYRGPNVKATFEAQDPKPRCTDSIPTPLLAVSIMLLGSALIQVINAFAIPMLPIPGGFLTGAPALLAILAMAVMSVLLAWGTLKRHIAAWWGMLAVLIAGGAYGFLTFRSLDLAKMYAAMEFPEKQIEMISRMDINAIMTSPRTTIAIALTWAGMIALVIWLKRFFRKDTPETAA